MKEQMIRLIREDEYLKKVKEQQKLFGVANDGRKNMAKNVHDIIYKYLKDNGFDGLYNPDADPGCACRVDKNDEFMVCDIVNEDTCYFCIPGYLTPCDPETCGEHKFHITVNKPQKAKRELLKGE